LQNEHNDDYAVPFDADLECKTHVVVYDGNTKSLEDCEGCKTSVWLCLKECLEYCVMTDDKSIV